MNLFVFNGMTSAPNRCVHFRIELDWSFCRAALRLCVSVSVWGCVQAHLQTRLHALLLQPNCLLVSLCKHRCFRKEVSQRSRPKMWTSFLIRFCRNWLWKEASCTFGISAGLPLNTFSWKQRASESLWALTCYCSLPANGLFWCLWQLWLAASWLASSLSRVPWASWH